jgi:maltose alpha-D-glucosyltransferase/alpha-amylase
MGDNVFIGDRNGVRTPMQWSPDRNAGFSRADPQRLYLPPIMDAVYGYEAVNVEAQLRSPASLLQWTRRMVAVRRNYRAFSRGSCTFLEPGNRKVLAFLREHDGEAMLCVANLSRVPQAVELDLARFAKRVPVEILGLETFPPVGKLPYLITLPGHGYFAFRLAADAKPPAWHEERLPGRSLRVLVLAPGWEEALEKSSGCVPDPGTVFLNLTHEKIRDEVLLPYIRARRWFAAKGDRVTDMRLAIVSPWKTARGTWNLGILEADLTSGARQRYMMPFALDWETRAYDPLEKLGAWALAKVRRRERMGALYDAFGNPEFARDLAASMGTNSQVPFACGMLRFSATALHAQLAGAIAGEVRIPTLEQSNTGVFFDNKLFLKGYRLLRHGVNPELEMARFLTEASPFPNIAPLVGAAEYVEAGDPEPITIAVLQKFVENRGDLWTLTQGELAQLLALPEPQPTEVAVETDLEAQKLHLTSMSLLGRRVAELHRALCKATGDAAFDPEPMSAADFDAWKQSADGEIDTTLEALERSKARLPEDLQPLAAELATTRAALHERVRALGPPPGKLAKTRFHGDLHLGQVLVAQDDFVIVDFEGEPARPFAERRQKSSPLRDVAGMLRSFSYATHAAMLARGAPAAASETGVQRLARWEREVKRAFLDGYLAASEGLASVPADRAALQAMLDLFVLEKALYELRYELDNRPDWVAIPLRGLLETTKK